VHGLAGSAAVALLVLPMIRNPYWATLYLLVFGAGTIAGMMLITGIIAAPISYWANRFQLFNRYVGTVAGALSVGFGLFLVHQIGFSEGLFR
jgi:sulfite exporter TauE/SafE